MTLFKGLPLAVLAVVLAACSDPAPTQAPSTPPPSIQAAAGPTCRLPGDVAPARQQRPPADEVDPDVPTTAYMLALTWAPEICRTRGRDRDYAIQCRDNDFGFVLHGLWPNGAGRRHPRYCAPAPPLDAATVRRHLCMTPAPTMLQHEWAAHGTCGWSTPEAYFDQAAALWESVRLPEMAGPTLTAGEIRRAFVAANPGLARNGINIRTTDDNRLLDVRLCYDLEFRPAACRGGLGAPDRVVVQIASRRN
ncbi:MAG: ribonuclease T [Caulobacter sp.]|nr:ribonuclease T [Caulobacter sp.]